MRSRLTVSVPIPVFDQNQGNILSAQESLAKTKAEREANRNTLIVVAGRAYDSLQGSLRELAVLRETAIPKATEAADAISQGYGQGRFTLLEVLDAQASVTQARLREQEALQNFHVGGRDHRRPRRQSLCAGAGERTMKTSSTILVAIVAAALGAYGYSLLAPAKVAHTEHTAEKKPEKPNEHVEQDEHGADRIRISDVKLAAAGVDLAEAASATLTDTLSFNGILRANQEAVVQVTPRFPGVAQVDPEAHRRQGRQGRSACHHREQPEPHRLRTEGADRRHDHRAADLARRIRLRAEAGLRRRRPLDHLGRSVDIPAGSQARPHQRRGADRSRRRPRRDQGHDLLHRTRSARARPRPRWPAWCCRIPTGGCGPACSSPRG